MWKNAIFYLRIKHTFKIYIKCDMCYTYITQLLYDKNILIQYHVCKMIYVTFLYIFIISYNIRFHKYALFQTYIIVAYTL